jgi:organic radical activating enzyme
METSDNKVICPLPFLRIYNNLDAGAYSPCCWSTYWRNNQHNITNTLPIEYFTGDTFNRIRKEMLEGEKTEFLKNYCNYCWKNEEKYGGSPRTQFQDLDSEYNVYEECFDKDGKIRNTNKRFIQLCINVYGNHCNLQCYECLPVNSSSRLSVMNTLNNAAFNDEFFYNPSKSRSSVSEEQFKKIVDEIVFYSDKILSIEVVGGEPMLMKNHFFLLDKLIECGQAKNIEIIYVSNMTMMNLLRMKKYFDNFMWFTIQWSVDALKERNNWLRYPTDWDKTLKNVDEVKKYLMKTNKGTIKSSITPSLLSITTFKETYDWLVANNYASPNQQHYNIIENPAFLSPQHLPQELKEKIAPEILKISKIHFNQLMSDQNETRFKLAINYADALDRHRGTNWRVTFPEIAEYAK